MANYKVIKAFKDLEDGDYIYRAGKPYPRDGGKPSAERIENLASENNRRKEVLIRFTGKVEVPEDNEGQGDQSDQFPRHTGGGYYELSNGDKVQGKEKANEAEQAL